VVVAGSRPHFARIYDESTRSARSEEYMFERCGDAELLDLMGTAQQEERAAFARQLMAVGTFAQRRMDQVYAEHEFWCVDDWEAIAAEIAPN
jgi:hypothetical protein